MTINQGSIEQILENCLELIVTENASIDSVLSHYPEVASILQPELEAAVWLLQKARTLDPRPGFLSASRRRVEAKIRREGALRKVGGRPVWKGFFASFWKKDFALQFLVVAFIICGLFAGLSGIALASQSALPGDMLYQVKGGLENSALALAFDSAGDARLHIQFAQRRLFEIQSLILEGRYAHIHETVVEYEVQVKSAIQQLEKLAVHESEKASSLATFLQETLKSQYNQISLLAGLVPEETRGEIEHVLLVSIAGVDSVRTLIITPSESFLSPTDPTATLTPTALPTLTPSIVSVPSSTAQATLTPTFQVVLPGETGLPAGTPTATPTRTPPAADTPTQVKTPRPTQPPPEASPTWTQPPPPTRTPQPPPTETSIPERPTFTPVPPYP